MSAIQKANERRTLEFFADKNSGRVNARFIDREWLAFADALAKKGLLVIETTADTGTWFEISVAGLIRLLTPRQKKTLTSIARWVEEQGSDGGYPIGASMWRMYRTLERRGLLRFAGTGAAMDSESVEPREVPIFELTNSARLVVAVLSARGASR